MDISAAEITGLEIVGDLYGCPKEILLQLKSNDFKSKLSALLKQAELQEVGSVYHDFDSGFTALIALAESHLAVHTWPDHGYVSLNIFVCNYTRDNTEKTRQIFQTIKSVFQPLRESCLEIKRNS
jgi:S-adenosylmethionine decarboxylase proenzyme